MKRAFILAITLCASPAVASSYCHVPPRLPEDAFAIYVPEACKQGDIVAIDQAEYAARACDTSRPVISSGPYVICSLGTRILERRAGPRSFGLRPGYPAVPIPAP